MQFMRSNFLWLFECFRQGKLCFNWIQCQIEQQFHIAVIWYIYSYIPRIAQLQQIQICTDCNNTYQRD